MKGYDEPEEELHAELFRREAESGDKKERGFNHLDITEDVVEEENWVGCWHQEHGWIQALRREDKTP